MICYRDRTYCPFWRECRKGTTCDRALTDLVEHEANRWWGKEGAPIAVFADKPDCFEPVKS